MIFTNRTITVRKGESRIDEPIVVYRGDYELEVRFTILNSKFKLKSGTNMIETEKASYGQLAILTPYGGNIFSDIVKCNDGSVTFVLTADMLNQIEEVGLYSFQIRLMDYNKESRVSIPPIEFGIEVREPIASEDHDNSVNNAIVGYSIAKVVDPKEEKVGDTFDESGNYNKTNWETGDRISEGKLNKIEDAIDKINENERVNTDALDKRMYSNYNVLSAEIETKADKGEVIKKGNATLNDFDEQTRATILGMSSGQINAVLGADNVTEYNIADDSIMPEHCKFLPDVMTDIYIPHLSVPGGLGGDIGDDKNVEGYYRTDYMYIGDSSEIVVEEKSGKLSINGTSSTLFAFLYMEKDGQGVDVNTAAIVEAQGTDYKIYNTNGYNYMRLVDVSPYKGDFRDTLKVYAIGKRNIALLSKYNLDERYITHEELDIHTVFEEVEVYDGVVLPGGFDYYGFELEGTGYARTDYIPLNKGGDAEGLSVTITAKGSMMSHYIFLYENFFSTSGLKIDKITDSAKQSSNSYTFVVPSGYRYLRMITKNPSFGDYSKELSIMVKNKASDANGEYGVFINGVNLDERYCTNSMLDSLAVVLPFYGNIYNGNTVPGGFDWSGIRVANDEYLSSEYLPINDGMIADGTKVDIWVDGYFGEVSPFIFVYSDNDGGPGLLVQDLLSYDQNTGITSFVVPKGGFRYLALIVKNPTYGDYHEGLVVQTSSPDGKESQVTIKGYNLDNRYALKTEVGNIVRETINDMDLSGGGGGTNKLPRPSSGVVNFVVQLNTNLIHEGDTLDIIDSGTTMSDNAILLLPTSYSASGAPTRLVINCHGAGTTITASTSSLTEPVGWMVNGLGYAVLDVNGVPKSLSSNTGLHYGSPLALQSYLKAYQYVIENYNIKSDGCFVMGTSMGGLTSFMLTQSGSIPVLAQAGMCPVTDHYKQAYCQPWNAPASQRSQIAKLFGFTGTEPTWTSNSMPSDEEKQYYLDNLDKVIGYNPMMKNVINWSTEKPYSYDRGAAGEAEAYAKLVKFHPVPLKIWHNDNDGTVAQRYSSYLVQAIRNAGGLAYLRKFPSGGHNAWNNGNNITATTIDGESYSINVSAYEVGLWFKRFDK